MAVRIRLKRMGRRNRPFYRICVFDGRTRRDGRSIEDIGFHDTTSSTVKTTSEVKADRARYWMSKGAKPSLTVHQIFKRLGVYNQEQEAATSEAE